MRGFTEMVGLIPMGDGVIVVGFVLVLAVGLSLGYAVLERYLGDRLKDAIDRE